MMRSLILCLIFASSVVSGSNAAFAITPSKRSSAVRSIETRRFVSHDVTTPTGLGIDEEYIPCPNREYDAPGVVKLCMESLQEDSHFNFGLEVCFNFSSDRCRASKGGNLQRFVQYANNPTFGSMVNAKEWSIVKIGNLIPKTPTRGAMQTCLVHVTPQKGNDRTFLWTLQQERRPPRSECWLVHECIFLDKAYELTV